MAAKAAVQFIWLPNSSTKAAPMICVIKGNSKANSKHLKTPEFLHGGECLQRKKRGKLLTRIHTHTKKKKTIKQKTSLNSSAQVKGSIFL